MSNLRMIAVSPRRERDSRILGRDLERIVEQIVEHLLEPARGHAGMKVRLDLRLDPNVALVGECHPGVAPFGHHGTDVNVRECRLGLLGASESEKTVDKPGEPVHFGTRALDIVGSGSVDLALEVLEPQPERGERGPQLVRGIRDECPLRVHELLELRCGRVELLREQPHLVRAGRDGCACCEVATAQPSRGVLQVGERSCHRAGEPPADEEHDGQNHAPNAGEKQPVASNTVGNE